MADQILTQPKQYDLYSTGRARALTLKCFKGLSIETKRVIVKAHLAQMDKEQNGGES